MLTRAGEFHTENHLIRSKAECMLNDFKLAHAFHNKPSAFVAWVVRWIQMQPFLLYIWSILKGQPSMIQDVQAWVLLSSTPQAM